ncbi:MAG: fructosamine kinase family protein [Armatimonadota bacterium]
MFDDTPLTAHDAEIILHRWLSRPVKCENIRRLHGGMVDSVLALEFDVPPYNAVVKVSRETDFTGQADALNYLRTHSRMPLPEVYLKGTASEQMALSFLLMEMLPGVNMGDASISPDQRLNIDYQLAKILIELHSHTGDHFGVIGSDETGASWFDLFKVWIMDNWTRAVPRLTQKSLDIIPILLDRMPDVFSEQPVPTLIHGDIWANNIMLDMRGDDWVITGFVDPGTMYADVEFELAYLEIFQTVTGGFFDRYYKDRPMRGGYNIRKLYYWLNTMLLHVWFFGYDRYIERTEKIAVDLFEFI